MKAVDSNLLIAAHRAEHPAHEKTLRRLKSLTEGDASGNLLFDAQIAAACRDAGAFHLVTADRDFARFPFLTIEAP